MISVKKPRFPICESSKGYSDQFIKETSNASTMIK